MAENVLITPGTGDTVAADDISGVKYQRVKIIQGADGVNDGDISSANPLPIVQTGTPGLPTGAATSAKQDTGNTSLSSIDGKITAVNTGAVIVASSALPSTAATSTKQSDGSQKTQVVDGSGNVIGATSNALDINIKSGNPTSITANAGTNLNTSALALASAQTDKSQFTKLTDGTDTALITASGEQNVLESNSAAIKTSVELIDNAISGAGFNITQFAGTNAVNGSGTATGALRVELPTNGTGVLATVGAVTAITNALPTGTNSMGKISDITTSIVPGTGATNLGKAEDAAHASGDTGVAVWGVRNDNAATTYGNDQDYGPIATDLKGRVSVRQTAATGTLSNVASSATSVTVLAANSARIGAQFYNDSTQICYLKFGATASTSSFTVPLAAATYYELPGGYTGIIDGIWASANGNMRVTELV